MLPCQGKRVGKYRGAKRPPAARLHEQGSGVLLTPSSYGLTLSTWHSSLQGTQHRSPCSQRGSSSHTHLREVEGLVPVLWQCCGSQGQQCLDAAGEEWPCLR